MLGDGGPPRWRIWAKVDYFFTFPDQGQSSAQLVGLSKLDLCSKYIVCLDPYLEAVFKREQTKATSVERRLVSSGAIYAVHDFLQITALIGCELQLLL